MRETCLDPRFNLPIMMIASRFALVQQHKAKQSSTVKLAARDVAPRRRETAPVDQTRAIPSIFLLGPPKAAIGSTEPAILKEVSGDVPKTEPSGTKSQGFLGAGCGRAA